MSTAADKFAFLRRSAAIAVVLIMLLLVAVSIDEWSTYAVDFHQGRDSILDIIFMLVQTATGRRSESMISWFLPAVAVAGLACGITMAQSLKGFFAALFAIIATAALSGWIQFRIELSSPISESASFDWKLVLLVLQYLGGWSLACCLAASLVSKRRKAKRMGGTDRPGGSISE